MASTDSPKLKQAFWWPKARTTNKVLTGTDSGIAWCNKGATGAITFTLPKAAVGLTTVVVGLQYQFLVSAAQSITITPLPGDAIRGLPAGTSTTLTTVGQIVELECITPGFWEIIAGNSNAGGSFNVIAINGTANEITVTSTSGVATVSFANNIIVPAPPSGVALTVNGVGGGTYTTQINSPSDTNLQLNSTGQYSTLGLAHGGTDKVQLYWDNTGTTFHVSASSGAIVIASSTGTTLPAPSSGASLTVDGVANNDTLIVQGSSTTGQSYGLNVIAGTNATDSALRVNNSADSIAFFRIDGTGNTTLYDGSTGLFNAGYKEVPYKTIGVSTYTPILSDSGKYLDCNSTVTAITLPTNASVPYPLGTVLTFLGDFSSGSFTIAAGSGETLFWAGRGSQVSGTRTIGVTGLATCLRISTTQWVIAGSGIS